MGRNFNVVVKAFRALDEPELCRKFIHGHAEVLSRHSFGHISSANPAWMFNPNVYVLLAYSKARPELLLGGGRIEVKGEKFQLPVEKSLASLDHKIIDLVGERQPGTSEFCGLWNSRHAIGRKITTILVLYGFSLLSRLHLRSCFLLCSPHTFYLAEMLGCRKIIELGSEGAFDYPTDRFKAYVWVKEDVHYLQTVVPYIKERTESIRKHSTQVFLESHITKGMNVHYEDAIRYDE
jgi:hypothetical protein